MGRMKDYYMEIEDQLREQYAHEPSQEEIEAAFQEGLERQADAAEARVRADIEALSDDIRECMDCDGDYSNPCPLCSEKISKIHKLSA